MLSVWHLSPIEASQNSMLVYVPEKPPLKGIDGKYILQVQILRTNDFTLQNWQIMKHRIGYLNPGSDSIANSLTVHPFLHKELTTLFGEGVQIIAQKTGCNLDSETVISKTTVFSAIDNARYSHLIDVFFGAQPLTASFKAPLAGRCHAEKQSVKPPQQAVGALPPSKDVAAQPVQGEESPEDAANAKKIQAWLRTLRELGTLDP